VVAASCTSEHGGRDVVGGRNRRGDVTAARSDVTPGRLRRRGQRRGGRAGGAGRDLVGEAGGCAVEADAHATSSATLASWARRSERRGVGPGARCGVGGSAGSRDAVATGRPMVKDRRVAFRAVARKLRGPVGVPAAAARPRSRRACGERSRPRCRCRTRGGTEAVSASLQMRSRRGGRPHPLPGTAPFRHTRRVDSRACCERSKQGTEEPFRPTRSRDVDWRRGRGRGCVAKRDRRRRARPRPLRGGTERPRTQWNGTAPMLGSKRSRMSRRTAPTGASGLGVRR